MLTIRCSKCKTKLFKYQKIGNGKVLKCFKDRMELLEVFFEEGNLKCLCGQIIGTDSGLHYKMKTYQFVYTGKKEQR